MSEIEIPDWVVSMANDVLADHSLDGDGVSHEALRAALNAALGAWVVPVGTQHRYNVSAPGEEGRPWFHSSDRDLERIKEYYRDQYDLRTLYTLRQEKPDVLP